MSEEFRGDEMPRLRRRGCIIRVFVCLAFLFTALSVIVTHTELQQKHQSDLRSLDHGQASITWHNVSRKLNATSRMQNRSSHINDNRSLMRRTSNVKTNITREQTPKNRTYVLPPRQQQLSNIQQQHQQQQQQQQQQLKGGDKTTNQSSKDVSQSLEEEQFILVETHRAKVSREKERRKKEELLRKRTWAQIQEDRKQHLKDTCARRPELREDLKKIIYNERSRLSNFIVNDRLRVVFATIPMVASRLFEKVPQQPQKKQTNPGKGETRKNVDIGTFRNLSSYNGWEIRYRLTHYKKLIFVRDPFARVLSTYRRKFLPDSTKEKKMYGRLIAQSTKQELQPELFTSGDVSKGSIKNLNITFKEFIYFVNAFTNYLPDSQWYPMSKVALPCEIDYDFIGKLEEGPMEFTNMMKAANIDWLTTYGPPPLSSTSHQGAIYDKYFLQLWPVQIRELYRLYQADFDLFQYTIPTYMRPWVFDKF